MTQPEFERRTGATTLAITQGAYFVATGIWLLLHTQSFEAVTGPKSGDWLIKTVGMLVTANGAILIGAAPRRDVHLEAALLGAGSAAGLAGIDIEYGLQGRIRCVYLADAVAQVAIVGLWARFAPHSLTEFRA
jgi:hypothetical protein